MIVIKFTEYIGIGVVSICAWLVFNYLRNIGHLSFGGICAVFTSGFISAGLILYIKKVSLERGRRSMFEDDRAEEALEKLNKVWSWVNRKIASILLKV